MLYRADDKNLHNFWPSDRLSVELSATEFREGSEGRPSASRSRIGSVVGTVCAQME